ncbi:MAG: ABC transporter permease [Sulfurimonas sp.]
MDTLLQAQLRNGKFFLEFAGEFTLYKIPKIEKQIKNFDFSQSSLVTFDLNKLTYLDSAAALFIAKLMQRLEQQAIPYKLTLEDQRFHSTLELVKKRGIQTTTLPKPPRKKVLSSLGEKSHRYTKEFMSFIEFLGKVFVAFFFYLKAPLKIRYKEIFFEINESGIKAIAIISLTSFLVGLVVAYQSAYQLKIYGANIFIVDMLGLSIFRELAPLITAIVIAGRSGSAYTAQIGAMKITEEIDAMRTMGFEPFAFLVLPRIIALIIVMPMLIFISDITGMLGGILIANLDLKITTELFIERFHEVIAAKHFFVGIVKGPFFAFLIASIAIFRGLIVKDDTQSIGFNTTKSVVESIFAVIICDAVFSIAFTNLGI